MGDCDGPFSICFSECRSTRTQPLEPRSLEDDSIYRLRNGVSGGVFGDLQNLIGHAEFDLRLYVMRFGDFCFLGRIVSSAQSHTPKCVAFWRGGMLKIGSLLFLISVKTLVQLTVKPPTPVQSPGPQSMGECDGPFSIYSSECRSTRTHKY